MALPAPRAAAAAQPHPARLQEHRMPRRRARPRRHDFATDDSGALTRWDGCTTKPHPVTGEPVPDEICPSAAMALHQPAPGHLAAGRLHRRQPPFIGAASPCARRSATATPKPCAAWPAVPESADFVMFWWHHAADLTRRGGPALRLHHHQQPGTDLQPPRPRTPPQRPAAGLACHPRPPWVDAASGAAVRIAMTVGGSLATPRDAANRRWRRRYDGDAVAHRTVKAKLAASTPT